MTTYQSGDETENKGNDFGQEMEGLTDRPPVHVFDR